MSPDARELLKHQGFVRAIARRLLRDESRVDDVVQDTWVVALERPPRPGPIRAWLATVARNLALRKMRDDARRGRRERAAARVERLPASGDLVAQLETHRRVVEAFLTLDEPYRTTILLRFYKGLSSKAIGRRMGVPAATVRTRVRAALGLLRGRLARDHGDDRRALAVALLPLAQLTLRPAWLGAVAASALVSVVTFLGFAAPDAPRSPVPHPTPTHGAAAASLPVTLPTAPADAPASAPEPEPQRPAVPVGVIEGVVLEDGRPLPGGRAYVRRYESYQRLPVFWHQSDDIQHTEIDARGVFRFYGQRPGNYAVAVAADGRPVREAVTVPRKRVFFRFGRAAIRGLALDAVGRPHVGARVQINRKHSPVSVWVEVGAHGTYYADALPEGAYWVAIIGPGPGRANEGLIARDTELQRGRATTFDLGRAAALPRWTGVLRYETGEVVGPARIQLDAEAGGYQYVEVGRDGRFSVPLMPGKYAISLYVAGHRHVSAGDLDFPDTDHWQDVHVPGVRLRGRVVNPKPRSFVRLDGLSWVLVAADGTFTIEAAPPGTHCLDRHPPDLVVHVAPGALPVVKPAK